MMFFPVSQSVADQPPFRQRRRRLLLGLLLIPAVIVLGLGFSVILAEEPLYGGALVVAAAGLYLFFRNFELTVVGLLCLRSFLDFYSSYQMPAAFAIGVDLLVLLYVGRQLILRQPVHTDPFWWFLMGWVVLQGFWVALLPTSALGGTAFMAYEAMREWVRFFSLAMVYLLVMQLRDRIPPDKLISLLFISLIIPLLFALLQALPIQLPDFLQSNVGWKDTWKATEARVTSTLGHYNSFASFSLLFMALSLWRVQMARKPLGWLLLVAGTLTCLVLSKSLTGLVMLLVFSTLYFLPKLKGKGIWGALALGVALVFILSSEAAQERLVELDSTPLLNSDLSFARAAALQSLDNDGFRNSFNWRLLQWQGLIKNWQLHPWLGYGLASAKKLSQFGTTSHNDYVRFLVEEGIVGLGLFITFLLGQVARTVQIMRRSLPGSPQRALSQTLFAFSIAMMVGMAAGNVMVHTATFFYWWVLLAVLGWQWPARFGERPQNLRLAAEGPGFDDLFDDGLDGGPSPLARALPGRVVANRRATGASDAISSLRGGLPNADSFRGDPLAMHSSARGIPTENRVTESRLLEQGESSVARRDERRQERHHLNPRQQLDGTARQVPEETTPANTVSRVDDPLAYRPTTSQASVDTSYVQQKAYQSDIYASDNYYAGRYLDGDDSPNYDFDIYASAAYELDASETDVYHCDRYDLDGDLANRWPVVDPSLSPTAQAETEVVKTNIMHNDVS